MVAPAAARCADVDGYVGGVNAHAGAAERVGTGTTRVVLREEEKLERAERGSWGRSRSRFL